MGGPLITGLDFVEPHLSGVWSIALLSRGNELSVDNYLPINLVMATMYAWCLFPQAAEDAPGPTSSTARPSRRPSDDPSQEPASPGGEDTVSVQTWRASV